MLRCGVDKGKEASQTISKGKKYAWYRGYSLYRALGCDRICVLLGFFSFLFSSITTSDRTTWMFLITRMVAVRRQFLPSVLGCSGLFWCCFVFFLRIFHALRTAKAATPAEEKSGGGERIRHQAMEIPTWEARVERAERAALTQKSSRYEGKNTSKRDGDGRGTRGPKALPSLSARRHFVASAPLGAAPPGAIL